MKKNNKNARIAMLIVIALVMSLTCLTTACQQTPQKVIVTEKYGLEESIKKTSAPSNMEPNTPLLTSDNGGKWEYSQEYNSGNSVIVEATLYNNQVTELPVISVSQKKFEDGEQLKQIVKVFCPKAKVYNTGDVLTTATLQKNIMEVKEEIFRVENDMPVIEGDPDSIVLEDQKEGYILGLKEAIKYYESSLETAPDESELEEATYQFVDRGTNGYQCNMTAITDDATTIVDFVNRETGSSFLLESSQYLSENSGIFVKFARHESFIEDEEFLDTKEITDQCVQNMEIDYMSLNSVCKGEKAYSFYYTRTYKGLQETYINQHIGTTTTGTDGSAIMMSLWRSEYLYIEVQNGEVVKVRWENPSKITNIDNDNVEALPWEEIKEIFITQMEFLLSPDDVSNNLKIYINRIELGLTKILMKDSRYDYKLIPTWSFFGYDQYKNSGSGGDSDPVCFITVNAIDGTVVDRGLMY